MDRPAVIRDKTSLPIVATIVRWYFMRADGDSTQMKPSGCVFLGKCTLITMRGDRVAIRDMKIWDEGRGGRYVVLWDTGAPETWSNQKMPEETRKVSRSSGHTGTDMLSTTGAETDKRNLQMPMELSVNWSKRREFSYGESWIGQCRNIPCRPRVLQFSTLNGVQRSAWMMGFPKWN
jgi:hypothetical protein